jgi:hypothetical protein
LLDFVDAKPLWAALYHSLNPMNTDDYEHRRLSIHEIPSRCNALTMRNKLLILDDLVAREGVAPPTPAFSGLHSYSLTTFSINNLTREDGQFIVTIL